MKMCFCLFVIRMRFAGESPCLSPSPHPLLHPHAVENNWKWREIKNLPKEMCRNGIIFVQTTRRDESSSPLAVSHLILYNFCLFVFLLSSVIFIISCIYFGLVIFFLFLFISILIFKKSSQLFLCLRLISKGRLFFKR